MTIKEITEGWNPKNKAKHRACQQKVKNRVSVWPSAYASAQVVQCYYGKKKRKKKVMTITEIVTRTSKYFHGTGDVYLREIQQHGLKTNEKGRLYLTTNPFTARVEAYNTVIGDLGYGITSWPPKPKEITSPGTGGNAVVIELDSKFIDPRNLKLDPEYPIEDQAYYLNHDLPSEAIVDIAVLGSKPSQDIIDYWMGV